MLLCIAYALCEGAQVCIKIGALYLLHFVILSKDNKMINRCYLGSRFILESQNLHSKYSSFVCLPKDKCVREGTFFVNRFPSLANFVNKKVVFRKN